MGETLWFFLHIGIVMRLSGCTIPLSLNLSSASAAYPLNRGGGGHPTPLFHHYSLMQRSNFSSMELPRIFNPIDFCWRVDPTWATHRTRLASCALGYGADAIGGLYGTLYVVTDPRDDPVDPWPGTLRHAVIQPFPLWIIFASDMLIVLKNELLLTSFKTLDGRGAHVHIAYGPCITLQNVSNIIIHGLNIHDCKAAPPGLVRSNPTHVGHRGGTDGDGISLYGATNIWIDHNSLWNCVDGLIDATHGSTAITISNNLFTHHNEVMLLGHSDSYVQDVIMRVTIAYNRFGPGCTQRMPRCRFGYAHIVNNNYKQWNMYAIGGSANPTILSEGNRFEAPNNPDAKQVTKRQASSMAMKMRWRYWNWRSRGDIFINGAYFVESGEEPRDPSYTVAQDVDVKPATLVPWMTADAGSLNCMVGVPC